MQEGMLFHVLYEPGSGAYVVHVSFTIEGDLNVSVFKRCWQQIADRHSSLRTAFRWEHLERPLQIVQTEATLSWDELDWRRLSGDQQAIQLEAYIQKSVARGFNLTQAPLMRLGLFHLADNRYAFVLQYSHLVLDGWSVNLVFKELFEAYNAHLRGTQLHWLPSRPYRDFILWMQKQDKAKTEAFWRKNLQGFKTPTPLQLGGETPAQNGGADFAEFNTRLEKEIVNRLKTISRQNRITLNIVVQGAWANLLVHYSGKEDVLFGVAVTGRPVSLPGADAIVGQLVNTLPLRVRVTSQESVLDWLRSLQEHQAELLEHQHSSLVEIRSWSEIQATLPLFESCVIFENQPGSGQAQTLAGIRWIPHPVIERGAFPVTLVAEPGDEMILRVAIDNRRFARVAGNTILHHVKALLTEIAENPRQKIGELSLLRSREKQVRIELEKNEPGSVEALSPLSPVQDEVLAAVAPELAGNCSEQLILKITGEVNEEFLQQAWARLPDRLDCLRTSIHYKLLNRPLQVVWRVKELPFQSWDWVNRLESEKPSLMQDLLNADRNLGFDLSKAPLMRINAVRWAKDDWRILVTYHLVIFDISSVRALVESFAALYSTFCQCQQIPLLPARSYQDYIRWLQNKDEGAAKIFWRRQMEGFDSAILFSSALPPASPDVQGTFRITQQTWDEQLTSNLKDFAFAHDLSPETVIISAWALLLARYTGQNDVLLCVATPGSVTESSVIPSTAGRLMNALPLRVAVNHSDLITDWLWKIEQKWDEQLIHAHNSMTQVRAWAGLQAEVLLCDHAIVFEDFPQPWTLSSPTGPLTFEYEMASAGSHPLTMFVHVGTEVQWKARYNASHFEEQRIQIVIVHLRQLTTEILQKAELSFRLARSAQQNALLVSN